MNKLSDIETRNHHLQRMRDSIARRKRDLRNFLVSTGGELTKQERAYLLLRNADFRGDLFDVLERFLGLDLEEQLQALDRDGFGSLPWSSLIQSHPYVYLDRWSEFFRRDGHVAGA